MRSLLVSMIVILSMGCSKTAQSEVGQGNCFHWDTPSLAWSRRADGRCYESDNPHPRVLSEPFVASWGLEGDECFARFMRRVDSGLLRSMNKAMVRWPARKYDGRLYCYQDEAPNRGQYVAPTGTDTP